MITTNSLGSNYTVEDVKRSLSLLLRPSQALGGTRKLQSDLAEMFGVSPQHVSLFYKGRQALSAALEQRGVVSGDEVVIQAFTCAVLPESIAKTGATPVYVDVAPRSLNPTLASIKKVSTSRTKALILQHTLGFVNQETKDIVAWSKEKKITIIQDLAHALGAPRLEKFLKARPWRTPRPGLLRRSPIVLSFSQDKVIDGISGGALISGNINLLDYSINQDYWSIKKLLFYPAVTWMIRQTYNLGLGKAIHALAKTLSLLPSPMDVPPDEMKQLPEQFASLALSQLEKLPEILAHRQRIALIYDGSLKADLKMVSPDDIRHGSNLRYPIWVNNRDELEERLKRHGFYLLDHWYDTPVSPSWHPANQTYHQGSCPNAEELSRHIFNLPTHINTSAEKAQQLTDLINQNT